MTTVKHRNFVAEPIGEKPVTEVAGIGNVYGTKLAEQGFDKAYILLGNFLVFKKNEELFTGWLADICGASKQHAKNCYTCLREWSDAFL